MGILDGIVSWILEQVINLLDLITTSVLGALGCDMEVFLRYFPVAATLYNIFVAVALGFILLNWVWQLFKNFGLIAGVEAEDPIKLTIRTFIFVFIVFNASAITNLIIDIGGTPYDWIMVEELPPVSFEQVSSILLVILGVITNGSVVFISLVILVMLAWNFFKLLLEAAERYLTLGIMVFTAPIPLAMGASQTTAQITKSWGRMLGSQIFLLLMNAWCLRLFTSMFATFIANPLSL